MTLKAFEPKKFKYGKTDMNILAQTSSNKPHHIRTGHEYSPTIEGIFKYFGIQEYEFEIMDYFVVIIGLGVLITVIVVACICFPPYKTEEDWARIEKERDERDEAEMKKKKEEEKKKKE